MTTYERGQRDMQRRAAATLAKNKIGDELAYGSVTQAWLERAILSLPIVGEATNPGEQVVRDAHTEDGSKHCVEPARPGPSQECVMVPLLAWEYAITRLRGLHGLRLEGEPKPIDNAHFFKLLAAREE